MYTSETAVLPGGDTFFYTDTGVPSEYESYRTIVMFHGTAFHEYTFRKLHQYAHSQGMRIIIPNRKGYPGSSPITAEDLDDMENGREVILNRMASTIAELVLYLVQRHDIPKLSADRVSGGVSVLGWSMGTPTATSLFAKRENINSETYNVLQEYMKDLIIYDPPYVAFGYKLPEGSENKLYNPYTDPECKTVEESMKKFVYWVSSYCDHPDPWSGNIFELDMRIRTEECTLDSWTPEDWQNGYNIPAAMVSDVPMHKPPMQPQIAKMMVDALFDEKSAEDCFPAARVLYITCGRSFWRPIWTSYETKRRYENGIKEGKKLRSIKFVTIKNANHFVHYDDPETFLKTVIF